MLLPFSFFFFFYSSFLSSGSSTGPVMAAAAAAAAVRVDDLETWAVHAQTLELLDRFPQLRAARREASEARKKKKKERKKQINVMMKSRSVSFGCGLLVFDKGL